MSGHDFGVCEQCGERMVDRIGWDSICSECADENADDDYYEDDDETRLTVMDEDCRLYCLPAEVACGSDEELELRATWLSRLMFGWMIGSPEERSYEVWLRAQGMRLA